MDALSIMNAHVPGFRPYAKELVDKTNRVRKVHAGDKHFVDLSDYGTARAKAAVPKGAAANDRLNDLDGPQVGM